MIELTEQECFLAEALIAEHVFGYRWYYFPANKKTKAWCGLHLPSKWQKRHGAKRIDHPRPKDEIDTDVPHFARDPQHLAAMIHKCLEREFERGGITFYQGLDGGFCVGDIQGEHYASLSQAMAMYTLDLFKIKKLFRKKCQNESVR